MMRQRLLPLALTAFVTALAVLYFYESERAIRNDKWLALALVSAWSLIFVQMLIATDRWRLLELALLVSVVGLIAFFGSFLGPLWGWWEGNRFISALFRGCFLVSAPMLILHSLRLLIRDRPHWLRGGNVFLYCLVLVIVFLMFLMLFLIGRSL